MQTHTEIIKCPECEYEQMAKVQHTEPFYIYVHRCNFCKHVITESDWVKVPDMTIYISGSISNDPKYIDKFATYKRVLQRLYPEAQIICPVTDVNHSGHDKSWKAYMRVDIEAMKPCTHIALIPGWHNSRGAKIEYWLAKRWGMEAVYLQEIT